MARSISPWLTRSVMMNWLPPMFGHQAVSILRHSGAVLGAALFTSMALALFSMVYATVERLVCSGALLPLGLLLTTSVAIWLGAFVAVVMGAGFFFTLAYFVLGAAKRNFGWFYPALGLVAGVTMIQVHLVGRGYYTRYELLFASVMGLVAGFSYWMLAVRSRPRPASAPSPEDEPYLPLWQQDSLRRGG